MGIIRQHKTTSSFIGLLILAGICNLLTGTPSTLLNSVMFGANFMILISLLLIWAQTVRTRLLPTKARSYMIVSAGLLIFYIMLRVIKSRIIIAAVLPSRYLFYAYFIPRIMVPTLLLATAVNIALGETRLAKNIENALLIAAGALTVLALTNDITRTVYIQTVPSDKYDGSLGTYIWGPGFYVLYAWVFLSLILGLVFLFYFAGRKSRRLVLTFVLILLVWIASSLFVSRVLDRFSIPGMYSSIDVEAFCMIWFFECCIRSRLIPHNENYGGFFEQLRIPILITDADLNTVHATSAPAYTDKDILRKAVEEPYYPEEDTRLSSMKIRAGYAFWTENEKELHEQRRRLAEANELLSEENDLIAVENKLKEQKAHLDAQDMVYGRITKAIHPKQKRIEDLLQEAKPDEDSFSEVLGRVCVLNAYSKRKTNLLLLSEETLPENNRELYLALAETCRFLKCLGIDAAAIGEEYSSLPLATVNELYDTFETVIETYLQTLSRMTVSIIPDGVRIAMEAKEELPIPNATLPVVCKESDGILFITIISRKEGDAA